MELPFEIWNQVSIEKAWLSFFGGWGRWTALIRGDYSLGVLGANAGYSLKPSKLVFLSEGFNKKSTISEHFLFCGLGRPKSIRQASRGE